MMLHNMAIAASLALGLVSGTAHAARIAISYNYTAHAGAYPSDDPPSGNQYVASGSGYGVVDIDQGYAELRNSDSGLLVSPGVFTELFARDEDGEFSFAVDLAVANDFTKVGTFAFSTGLTDLVGDPSAFNGGNLYIAGGTGPGDGFDGPPTFDVTGTITFSQVSAVPLPAAAPMFGAALIGLASLGYAANRKRAAAV